MSSGYPRWRKKHWNQFDEFLYRLDHFFNLPPPKGFLQSIDELFHTPSHSFSVHLDENDNDFIITASLPGIHKEQIHLEHYANSIIITVKNDEKMTEQNDQTNSLKYRHSFQMESREVSFPKPIEENNIQAKYENGMLTIIAPKRKGKKIQIEQKRND